MNACWSQILIQLHKNLPEPQCRVWLDPLKGKLRSLKGESVSSGAGGASGPVWSLELAAANDFVATWVRERLSSAILQAASEVLGCRPELRIVASSARERPRQEKPVLPSPLSRRELNVELKAERERSGRVSLTDLPSAPAVLAASEQLVLPVSMPHVRARQSAFVQGWKYSFAAFVVGASNQLAHAAATQILHATDPVDMLFLSSASGLGKTHLAQAVGRALCDEGDLRGARVEYLTAEEYTTMFVQASRFGQMNDFNERFRNLDMLLLEDVHFLRGKDKTQEALLATIKTLQSRGGRVVLTSSFAPRDLQGVDSQLVSRFCSGFVASIARPDRETRLHILQRKARRNSIILPDSVAAMLADRITGDVRMLEGCLNNLTLQARLEGCPVSEAMAFEVIRQVARENSTLSLEEVVELVCRSYKLTPSQLASRSRRQELVMARNTAYFLLRKHTDMTLEEIGSRFNRRHSSVLKGITSLEREISRQSPVGRQISHTVRMIEKNSLHV